MGTAIKHPVPDRVKPSFVIFDTRALCVTLRPECQSARMSKITNEQIFYMENRHVAYSTYSVNCNIKIIIITHRDKFCRLGLRILETVCLQLVVEI